MQSECSYPGLVKGLHQDIRNENIGKYTLLMIVFVND